LHKSSVSDTMKKLWIPNKIHILIIASLFESDRPLSIYEILKKYTDQTHTFYSNFKTQIKQLVDRNIVFELNGNIGKKKIVKYKLNMDKIVIKAFFDNDGNPVPMFAVKLTDDIVSLPIPQTDQTFILSKKELEEL